MSVNRRVALTAMLTGVFTLGAAAPALADPDCRVWQPGHGRRPHGHRPRPRPSATPTNSPTATPAPSATATPSPTATAPAVGAAVGSLAIRSGLPWSSGAFTAHRADNARAFEAGRGLPLDNYQAFNDRRTARAGLGLWWLDGARPVIDNGGLLVVGIPLWHDDQTINTDTASWFRDFGAAIQREGLASRTIVRLAWEMNLDGWRHSVNSGNRALWVQRFKTAVTEMRKAAPGIRVAFNPNEGRHGSVDIPALARELLPFYEFVGPDRYNHYPVMNDEAAWQSAYTRPEGLKFWEDFARSNKRGYIVPEWGGYPGSDAGRGSDSVFYVRKMIERFRALAAEGIPVVEGYFNEPDSYIANSLYNPSQLPAAAAAYRAALRG